MAASTCAGKFIRFFSLSVGELGKSFCIVCLDVPYLYIWMGCVGIAAELEFPLE
jgi:hypothetical protein